MDERAEKLGVLAHAVSKRADAREEAFARMIREEAQVLEAVVDQIMPALRWLGDRQCIKWSRDTPSSEWRDEDPLLAAESKPLIAKRELSEERYVCLSREGGLEPKKEAYDEHHHFGAFVGTDVALDGAGQLYRVNYVGEWADEEDCVDTWEAMLTPISSSEAVGLVSLDAAIGLLESKLEQQLRGKTAMRTAQLTARAEKLSAIRVLLSNS